MEIAEVIDRGSLKAYLDGLPDDIRDQTARYVASRAAARVTPAAFRFFAQNAPVGKKGFTALPVWGAVAGAAVGLFGLSAFGSVPASSAFGSVPAAAFAAADTAADAADAASDGAVIWPAVRDDLAQTDLLLPRALWPNGAMPQYLSDDWATARAAFAADKYDTDWRFWITWYERMLAGKNIHPDLLAPILSKLTKEDWLGDPAVVTALFDDVLAVYDADESNVQRVLEATPYAMRVEVDGRSLVGLPSTLKDMSEILNEARLGLKDFLDRCRKDKSPNKFGEQMLEALDLSVKALRRDFRRHKNDAGRLYDGIKATRMEMTSIALREHFQDANGFGRFSGILSSAETDICIVEPNVLKRQQNRTAVEVALFSAEEKLQAMRMTAGLALNSKGDLQAASRMALIHIIDPSASEDEKKNAWYFVRAMIPRGAQVLKEEELKPASRSKAKEYIQRAAELGSDINKIDKGIDGIQEMSSEGVDWATEAFTQISSGNWFGIF